MGNHNYVARVEQWDHETWAVITLDGALTFETRNEAIQELNKINQPDKGDK